MCYYTEQSETGYTVSKRFKRKIDNEEHFLQSDFINGFSHPNLPIITNTTPELITTNFSWGLLPSWSKDIAFRKNTLNARLETVEEKPSFKSSLQNRCLIISTGYYEWRWQDDKGKNKEKYSIKSANDAIFCFAGLYSIWNNEETGEEMGTFTMLTTAANETMQYVHNIKKRMPILLKQSEEELYLNSEISLQQLAYPNYDPGLLAFTV